MKFDEVISLGYNCEVSFRIKDYLGAISSYPYSWSYIYDRELFLKSLENVNDILTGEVSLLPWGMFNCKKYNMDFHSSKRKKYLFDDDGQPNEENVKKEKANLKCKMEHLSNKFIDLLKSDKNTLFVIKVLHDESNNDIKFVKDLYFKLLDIYKTKKFVLLVVFEEKYITKELLELETDRLKIRSVKYFADNSKTQTDGDLISWHIILSEFKVKNRKNIFKALRYIKTRIKKLSNN